MTKICDIKSIITKNGLSKMFAELFVLYFRKFLNLSFLLFWFVKKFLTTIFSLFFFPFISIRYILIIFAQYVLITVIWIPEKNTILKVINIVVFEFFVFLAFAAHLRTMFTDPVSFFSFHKQTNN